MTLDILKHHRLQEQIRTGLTRWKALIARGGYTEVILPHAQFIWNWEHHPEARRICEAHTKQPVRAEIACAAASSPGLIHHSQDFLPYLDLGLGVPVYSSWYLSEDDPCWEGQTYYPAGQPNSEIEAMWEQYPEIMRRCVLNGALREER